MTCRLRLTFAVAPWMAPQPSCSSGRYPPPPPALPLGSPPHAPDPPTPSSGCGRSQHDTQQIRCSRSSMDRLIGREREGGRGSKDSLLRLDGVGPWRGELGRHTDRRGGDAVLAALAALGPGVTPMFTVQRGCQIRLRPSHLMQASSIIVPVVLIQAVARTCDQRVGRV